MAANQAIAMEFSRQLDVQRIEQLQREVETLRDENKRMTVASEKSGRDQHELCDPGRSRSGQGPDPARGPEGPRGTPSGGLTHSATSSA